jgi:hypothetical protein
VSIRKNEDDKMSEEEFISKFPSLKGRVFTAEKFAQITHKLANCLNQVDIQRCCLDKSIVEKDFISKQKVRDTIEKVNSASQVGKFTSRNWAMILERELGF